MANIRNNERSEAIKVISHVNAFLRDKTLRIKSAGGETTITEGKKHMFPDVILYGDTSQTQVLQGWEIKMPDVSITDQTFVKDAQRKAITLGLNSCIIWNFTAGVLYERESDDNFIIVKRWDDTSYIKTRLDVDVYRAEWIAQIEVILSEVNEYFVRGQFRPANLGEIVSDTVLSEIILRNKALVADTLREASLTDTRIRAKLYQWWSQVKAEYVSEEANEFSAYARVIILNWSNRILFAHILKKYHDIAFSIDRLDFESTPEQANMIFSEMSLICDYHNIFAPIDLNVYLSADTWHDLMELNEFLSGNGMTEIRQTSLQTVLEHTVSSSKRELVGQFTTPAKLAELLVRMTVCNLLDSCIDPCCGTGSIPQAVLNYKISRGIPVNTALATTWASDKFSFPLQIASISMAKADAMNQPVKIFQHNVFDLLVGEDIHLTDPATGGTLRYELPQFGAIVSNLPFVPFEIIDNNERRGIHALAMQIKRQTGVELDERSDLYQYIVFALWKLLKTDGRLGVITSNSWLGTKAGKLFFEAIEWYYYVNQVHISGCGRWFHNAEVVTVILVLIKKDAVAAPELSKTTNFYIWKKRLQEMEAEDINRLTAETLICKNTCPDLLSMSHYTGSDIRALQNMNISLNSLFHDAKWLVELSDKTCPVTKYLNVTRGERRGWDRMFYPTSGHGIEREYIKKVLKSSRHLHSLHAEPDSDAFCCSETLETLQEKGHTGALGWIRSFENGLNNTGEPLIEVLAKPNMHWYEMRDTNTASFVTSMNPDKRLFVAKFDEPSFVNQRLIAFKCYDGSVNMDLIHAILNSLLGMLYIEAIGFGRGLGALDINPTNIRNMRMLDPAFVTQESIQAILRAFEPIKARDVMNTSDELEQPDRIAFDHAVLTAFELEDKYDKIKNTLLSMQRVRHSARE